MSEIAVERFQQQVAQALARLYDLAFLETSPLAALAAQANGESRPQGRALRKALLDAIESLRPPEGTRSEDAAWRPYRILEERYIMGLGLRELQKELSLAKSQYYREHARALQALSSVLRHKWRLGGIAPESVSAATDSANLTRDELAELARQEPPEVLDLADVLRDLGALLAPTIRNQGIAFHLSLPSDPLWVRSSPGVLRQSLLIPLSEAVSSLTEGRVLVSAFLCEGQIVIDIVSQGIAVPPSQAGSREIIQTFVEAAGGAAHCGADVLPFQMRLCFPALGRRPIVLLVDNSRELAALFERYLEGEPWSLVHAETVKQALEICDQQPPSLILLDVLMPGEDGWHLLKRLKATPSTAHIPVIICSVLKQPQLALSLGATGYLQKPVTQEALREALQRWGQAAGHRGATLPTKRSTGE